MVDSIARFAAVVLRDSNSNIKSLFGNQPGEVPKPVCHYRIRCRLDLPQQTTSHQIISGKVSVLNCLQIIGIEKRAGHQLHSSITGKQRSNTLSCDRKATAREVTNRSPVKSASLHARNVEVFQQVVGIRAVLCLERKL